MRAIATIALAAGMALASPAEAQYYPYRNGWVAPFVGGAIAGALVAPLLVPPPPVYVPPPAYYAPPVYEVPPPPLLTAPPTLYGPPPRRCWNELLGWDYYGTPTVQRVCN